MYHHLKGQIHSRGPDFLIVENSGIGYHVHAAVDITQNVAVGEEIFLYLHQHLSLDQTRASENLYGFLTNQHRELFRLLISVKGIGPKQALTVLSSCGSDALIEAIQAGNTSILNKIKGIGPKTAQRLILELKEKVGNLTGARAGQHYGTPDLIEDTLSALIALGYKEQESRKAIEAVRKESSETDVAVLVRMALQKI